MKLTKQLKADIISHALDCYPAECCGVIVNDNYLPCTNTATGNEQFILCPKDFAKAESIGEIQAVVHSHPDGGVLPSDLDKLQIELHGVPWVIVAVSKQDYGDELPLAYMSHVGTDRHYWGEIISTACRTAMPSSVIFIAVNLAWTCPTLSEQTLGGKLRATNPYTRTILKQQALWK